MTSKELREKRANLVAQGRAILDKVTAEKRAMTAEETQEYGRIDREIDALGATIEAAEKQEARERELALSQGTIVPKTNPAGDDGDTGEGRQGPRSTKEYRDAFARYFRTGRVAGLEQRALAADTDSAGGYLVPTALAEYVIMGLDNAVFIRQFATKVRVEKADSLGIPTLTADPADADWTTEIGTGSEDSTMAFGKRDLNPHPLAKLIKVSNKLLRVSPTNVEALVMDRLIYRFAVAEEKAFLTGSGTGQPLGLFTASANGISTARDISTDNTATAITADGLINAKYGLKPQYLRNARWIFHRDAVKMIRKLKDVDGQYLWRPGLANDQADTILDLPFLTSEYAPNTFTTGLYVGIVGDLSFYHIADALDMEVQRLAELYAATNQVGFIGRKETDGMPVLEEAFVRVKLA